MRRSFKFTSSDQTVIAAVSGELRKFLRAKGLKLSRETVAQAVTDTLNNIGRANNVLAKPEKERPIYSQSGDLMALAYQSFMAGDHKSSLETCVLAFTADDSRQLFDALVQCNDEALPEDLSGDDDDDDDDDDDNSGGDTDAESIASTKPNKLSRLIDSISKRTTTANEEMLGDDDDDDDDDNSGEEIGDDDDDDDDDDAAEIENADTGDAVTAKLIKRLGGRNDVVAAANKISMGGSKKSRKTATNFVRRSLK